MSEIKPVYQAKILRDGSFTEVTEKVYQEYEIGFCIERRILYPAAAYDAQSKRIKELESGIGCARSHPHENMNEVCQLKTIHAKNVFEDQARIESLRKQVKHITNLHSDIQKLLDKVNENEQPI